MNTAINSCVPAFRFLTAFDNVIIEIQLPDTFYPHQLSLRLIDLQECIKVVFYKQHLL